jgi:hypothetical protein
VMANRTCVQNIARVMRCERCLDDRRAWRANRLVLAI